MIKSAFDESDFGTRHISKWAMSLLLGTPQYLGGPLNKP